jgi:hypothetical protein
MDPTVLASTWSFGSHQCIKYTGIFNKNNLPQTIPPMWEEGSGKILSSVEPSSSWVRERKRKQYPAKNLIDTKVLEAEIFST